MAVCTASDTSNVSWLVWTDTATSTTNTWAEWNNAITVTSTAASDAVWVDWVSTGNSSTGAWSIWVSSDNTANNPYRLYDPIRHQETEEERIERERIEKEHQERLEKERKEQEIANERAAELFKQIVGDKSFELFKKHGYHQVISESGKRYRVRPNKMIDVMKGNFGDEVDHKLCIHHRYDDRLPPIDTMIHQMLLIMSGEAGENELKKIANKHAA